MTGDDNAAKVETPTTPIDELIAVPAWVVVDFGLEVVGIDLFVSVFLTEVDTGTGRVRSGDDHVVAADGGKTVE